MKINLPAPPGGDYGPQFSVDKSGLYVTNGGGPTFVCDPIKLVAFTINPATEAQWAVLRLKTRDGGTDERRLPCRDLDRDRKVFDYLADWKFRLPSDPALRKLLLIFLRSSNPPRRDPWSRSASLTTRSGSPAGKAN